MIPAEERKETYMSDRRNGLSRGTELVMTDGLHITINEEIGRGASCIVYDASYTDSMVSEHRVRLKECYPVYVEMERNENGILLPKENEMERFKEAKARFRSAYQKNVEVKNTLGLVNSTSNASGIYEKNDTLYSVLNFDEGIDYSKHEDLSLKEVCEYIKAIATVIQKYHDKGYLHLDIKPENVFVIPETREHVLLFDFDSVTTTQEIKDNLCYRLSYSDGFSAPELVRGRIEQIGTQTDIYSLGALLFYKIFNRKPTLREGALGATFDYSMMKYCDNCYSPKLYQELTKVFQKSLATSTISRWKEVSSFIDSLVRIIELADLEHIYLRGNFTYNTKNFIGRSDELSGIHDELVKSNVLFLSGIGGIGKTEIAKRYAYINQQAYDNIVFLPFSGSLAETFCSDELHINTLERGEEESISEYFSRKLDALKQTVTSRDLIIIDNFDVDFDDDLENILNCACKFLITTREDFGDYNYSQIEVNPMEELDDIRQVFETYNPREYTVENRESINNIIELVERHTMTVELFAKYLRDTDETPENFLKKLMEKEGVTNVGEKGVKHRKDRKLRAENIDGHLLALFDLSKFAELEEELIKSLALLGYIKISQTRFFEFFNPEGKEAALNNLIKRGWIEYDEITNKISLHQIILDLVLNHLRPTSSDCPNILAAMRRYAEETMDSNVAYEIREKLMSSFMDRIVGDDIQYAKLCVVYGNTQYLNLAENICESCVVKESKDVLQRICRLRMRNICECDVNLYDEEGWEEYIQNKTNQMTNMIDKAERYAKAFSVDPVYLGNFYVSLGEEILALVDGSDFEICYYGEDYNPILHPIYERVITLYDCAENYILCSEMKKEEKAVLIKKIQEFYRENGYCADYRFQHFTDEKRILYYQKLLDELRQNSFDASVFSNVTINGETFYLDDYKYSERAERAATKGEYEQAIEYYNLAVERDNEDYSRIYPLIADMYEKLRRRNMVEKYLVSVLKQDKENFVRGVKHCSYTNHVAYRLIQMYLSEQRRKKAIRYAKELIYFCLKKVNENSKLYHIRWLIFAYHVLYELTLDSNSKTLYWKECLKYYRMIDDDEKYSSEMVPFLLECIKKIENIDQKINKAYEFFERCESEHSIDARSEFLGCIIKLCENDKSRIHGLVIAFARYSAYLMECWPQDVEKAMEYVQCALEVIETEGISDEYCRSLVYMELGKCYSALPQYKHHQVLEVKGHCNYYLIAKTQGAEKPIDVRVKLFQEAANEYGYLENREMQKKCLLEGISLLQCANSEFEKDISSNYISLVDDLFLCCMDWCDVETLKICVNQMLHLILTAYSECVNCKQEFEVEEFYCCLSIIAGCLLRGNYIEESVFCYCMAVIVGIPQNINVDVLNKADSFKGLTAEIVLEFHKTLHGEVTSRGIDMIVYDVYQEIKHLLREDDTYREIEQDFLWFIDRYQKKDIEFKRE